ncbi:hypothetical protein, partial [Mesorhizobium sp. M1C.F.Ca.ET.187.01.1.1]|uniref:hypothetical protein n=1 Tax=Mesorhizobium sp. M1C.F.Ca.ET.187.01.1.1 TaxID=2563923 RepID=UPI001FE23B6E
GFQSEQVANALDGSVGIGLGILRQEFPWMQPTFRVTADDIGEGAAAVDPEIPFFFYVSMFPGIVTGLTC